VNRFIIMNLRSRLDFGAPVTLSLATAGGRLSYYSWSWPFEFDMARSPSVRAGEDVVRHCLALALGDDPMFDADSLTGKPVRPARDVAGSGDALDAVLEVLIDDSAAYRS
jgi:hypothetical protein